MGAGHPGMTDRHHPDLVRPDPAIWDARPWLRVIDDGEAPGASVVAPGVRGFPTIPRQLRIELGTLLHRACHAGGDMVIVHMDDLESLCHSFGVDFEFPDPSASVCVPLPLYISDDGIELTEDEHSEMEADGA